MSTISPKDYTSHYLNDLAVRRHSNKLSGFEFEQCEVIQRPAYSSVDWLKCTQPNKDHFTKFCEKAFPYLKNAGMEVYDAEKGMNGYKHSFAVVYQGERVGTFAADEKMGGLFELTGTGCGLLQANWYEWCRMICSLKTSGFGITRLDVCVDLQGVGWHNYGVTIPKMLRMVKKEGFLQVGTGAGNSPGINQFGDWTGMLDDEWDYSTYRPYLHSPDGLSFGIGKRNSANSFMVYEKGKEQFGKGMSKVRHSVTDSWVRVERRFTRGRGDSKVMIDFDFAVLCDRALFYRCPSLEKFVEDFYDWRGRHGMGKPQAGNIDLVKVGTNIKNRILKKTFWAAQHAGALVTTLLKIGFDHVQIVEMLSSGKLIKGYIDDITDKADIELEFMRIKRGMVHAN